MPRFVTLLGPVLFLVVWLLLFSLFHSSWSGVRQLLDREPIAGLANLDTSEKSIKNDTLAKISWGGKDIVKLIKSDTSEGSTDSDTRAKLSLSSEHSNKSIESGILAKISWSSKHIVKLLWAGLCAFGVTLFLYALWLLAWMHLCGVGNDNIERRKLLWGILLRKVNASVIFDSLIMLRDAGVKNYPTFFKDPKAPYKDQYLLFHGDMPKLAQALVLAQHAGLQIDSAELAKHLFIGGNVINVVRGLITFKEARTLKKACNARLSQGQACGAEPSFEQACGAKLSFEEACLIDLAGHDVVAAVNAAITPRVIDCLNPENGEEILNATTHDGIQLKVKAQVTVCTCIKRLVGSITSDEMISARVGKSIVSAIYSKDSAEHVRENLDSISKEVQEKNLDSDTAFKILSIDIVYIDADIKFAIECANAREKLAQAEQRAQIAENNADVKPDDIERADAQKKLAQAYAEKRTAEARAEMEEAEAEIPAAMAAALKSGNLGVMDYHRIKNVQSKIQTRETENGNGKNGNGKNGNGKPA